MYALKINEDDRILYACVVLQNGNYDGMPIVSAIPEGDVNDYLYVDGQYVYDPIPEPEHTEDATLESRVETLETDSTEMKEALEMILNGVTE